MLCALVLFIPHNAWGADAPSASQPAPTTKPHAILLTQSAGFPHPVVTTPPGESSLVEQIFDQLAEKGNFTVEKTRDAKILTPEKIKSAQLIVFYTTGELPMSEEAFKAFDQWIKDGGAFLGIHPATDTFHKPPFHDAYNNIINGEFEAHPWTQDKVVTLKVLDDKHPATKDFPKDFTHAEEIYQFRNFDPGAVRVVLSLDMEKTELKKPRFIPVAWCKNYGKGKVFYTSLGHRPDIWTNPVYQKHVTGAIQWLLNREPGDATPNPDVSKREEDISKKAAGTSAETMGLPTVPEGFTIRPFVSAPEIHSPASICATPDGKIFAGEDEYNTGGGTAAGTSRVKLCVDTNNDGKADKITVFADKLNSPQGMTFAGGTLYVVHAPFLTAFRDTNGDGVADSREDLVTGLGPVPEGLVHHVPSGLRMGPDGYLYISIGDKGVMKAVGKDGSIAEGLHGGGVIRVLPDGSHLEIFSHHTRNTFDVSVSPLLDLFTRDNTNDGGGWWSRITQMQRDGEYGYPSLYINFADEIIPCLAEFGGGSATGSMYVSEPGLPGTYGESLYTCDWARGILYQHDLVRSGATFKISQNEFTRGITPTDVDIDASGNMYLADWGRRDWGAAGKVGTVFRIEHKTDKKSSPIGNLSQATTNDLLALIQSPSQIRRREALCEIVKRVGTKPVSASDAPVAAGVRMTFTTALTKVATKPGDLHVRVAALFALARIGGEEAQDTLVQLATQKELREYALRALADRDDLAKQMKEDLFIKSLKDEDPRVRVQAAIALSHARASDAAARALIPLTADKDIMVAHAAQQTLRRLNAVLPLVEALSDKKNPADLSTSILRTARMMHDPRIVAAVSKYLDNESDAKLRGQAVRALACLYKVEAKWDGSWWTPRPDTRGPQFKTSTWDQTAVVAQRLAKSIDDPDPATAKVALTMCGLVQVPEAIPALARLIQSGGPLKDDAARALIDCKNISPESLGALEHIVFTKSFPADLRNTAASSLGGIETAQSTIIRLLTKLDSEKDLPGGLLDKLAESLSAKSPATDNIAATLALIKARQPSIRTAAATSLARSADAATRDKVKSILASDDAAQTETVLTALSKVPADQGKPYREDITKLLKDKRDNVRQAATVALGHLGDAGAVKELLVLARRETNPIPVVSALSEIAPNVTGDDQVLPIAELLVTTSVKASKADDQANYNKLVSAAQKFLSDPRVPTTRASTLLSQLKQPGVIAEYMVTPPLPTKDAASAYHTAFPPEESPAGPFHPFSVSGKEMTWKPMVVKDPEGKQPLDMPANSVMYLTATVESKAATIAQLSTGSDDGLHVWLNGKSVLEKDVDRGLIANQDKKMVDLIAGKNIFLFKVDNHGTQAGIQARLRARPTEFDPEDLTKLLAKIPNASPARGRQLFESAGCIKCHTTDRHEELKGPFLGDAGGKFPPNHLIESILRPSAKIAQGFQSEQIVARDKIGTTEYLGFPVKESPEEVQLRDLTGKVSIIKKTAIKKRTPLQGSIMPEGLAETMTLDDFGALLAYLRSLK
jgi:putative membrane-bound dehydrogenase-like protein